MNISIHTRTGAQLFWGLLEKEWRPPAIWTSGILFVHMFKDDDNHTAIHCNTLQHTATQCNTLQHGATRCSTLQHATTRYNTLQLTAVRCSTLQHPAAPCSTLQYPATRCKTSVIDDSKELRSLAMWTSGISTWVCVFFSMYAPVGSIFISFWCFCTWPMSFYKLPMCGRVLYSRSFTGHLIP